MEILVLVAALVAVALYLAHAKKASEDKPTLPTVVTDSRPVEVAPVQTGGGSPVEPVKPQEPARAVDDSVIRAMLGSLTPEQLASRNSGAAADNDGVRANTFNWQHPERWVRVEGGAGETHSRAILPPAGWSGAIEVFITRLASNLGACERARVVALQDDLPRLDSGEATTAGMGGRFAAGDKPVTLFITLRDAGAVSVNVLHQP